MSHGVFRPGPRIPWIRGRRPLPLPESPTRAQTGAGTAVAASSAQAVKVATVGGICSAVAIGAGAARKSAPAAGTSVAAAAAGSTPVKRAAPTGPAVTAGAPSATHSRISRESGSVVAVAVSTGRLASGQRCCGTGTSHTAIPLGKLVASQGNVAAVADGSGQARKVTAQGGCCVGAAVGSGPALRRAPARGVATGASVATARFAARTGGRGITLGGPTGTGRKVAVQGGRCAAAAAGDGVAARRTPARGTGVACAAPYGASLRRAPQAGRGLGLAVGRSLPVVPGPTFGTRVSPPLAIPDGPIAGSRIVWVATLDGGGVLVETSIDGGATWQPVESGSSIPRLVQGDTRATRTVLTRVTLTRATSESPSPRLHRLEVEVAVDSSVEETVPIGVFTLNDVEVVDSSRGLTVELAGADLSRRVSRNRWDDTYIIAEGTNYGTAIGDLIRNRLPDATFNFASTLRTTPRLFFGEQSSNDPWQDAQDMAKAIGYELFFDARGICTLRPEPDPDVDASVWEFDDRARPTMLELRRRVTDENTYNKVIATGEGTSNDAPVRGVAIDDDPASPTYYLGPYGTVTDRFTSPMITTAEQAQDAANARLLRVKGATEAVELEVVPMPALEPGDVVTVTRDRSKVTGRFLLDQLRIPLGASDPMRAVGRRQRQ